MKYYIEKTIPCTFDEAVDKIKSNLGQFGFGVVTEFDVDQKFKEKLNIDFRRYKIIGACAPKYAYEALLLEPLIGTMLPCNIVVNEVAKNSIQVAAIDPVASMIAVDNVDLIKAANLVKEKLQSLIDLL